MTVDHDAPTPAYEQLASILRAKIKAGEWRSGPLPSVKQLQQEHGVGRDTALRAIDVLRQEGLVFTVSRRGTYVTQDARRDTPGPKDTAQNSTLVQVQAAATFGERTLRWLVRG